MPQDESKIVVLLSLFAELEEGPFSCVRIEEVDYEAIDLLFLVHRNVTNGGHTGAGTRDSSSESVDINVQSGIRGAMRAMLQGGSEGGLLEVSDTDAGIGRGASKGAADAALLIGIVL